MASKVEVALVVSPVVCCHSSLLCQSPPTSSQQAQHLLPDSCPTLVLLCTIGCMHQHSPQGRALCCLCGRWPYLRAALSKAHGACSLDKGMSTWSCMHSRTPTHTHTGAGVGSRGKHEARLVWGAPTLDNTQAARGQPCPPRRFDHLVAFRPRKRDARNG